MTTSGLPSGGRGGRRREPWPLALAGLLLAMAVVLAAFLAAAITHPDAVLVDDAYAASERYDAALRSAERSSALGLRLELAAELAPGGARVALRLFDADGRALAADRVRLRRERPAQGGYDADIAVHSDGRGWTAQVALPLPGRWTLEGRAERGGETVVRRVSFETAP
jgi:nitrogen fixation protein FixH